MTALLTVKTLPRLGTKAASKAVRLAALCLPLLAVGCANLSASRSQFAQQTLAATQPLQAPPQWQAPLPHNGTLTDLSRWWQSMGDPLLVDLIEAGQNVSPTLASAKSRIALARAARVAAGAALLPTLDGSLAASRGATQPPAPVATTLQGGLQAAWEIDLFGGNRSANEAALARYESAQAQWHDARVSVAAEVANQYLNLRACEQQLALTRSDASSRQETARLSALTTRAGFTAPAQDALARASAAEAGSRVTQQRGQCDLDLKVLVALTALPEPELRKKLAVALVPVAQEAAKLIASIPADALMQRPDIFSAARDVLAASLDVRSTQAQAYPRLSLNGSIGALNLRAGGSSDGYTTWSIGPLALSMPLFDGGRRAANTDAAQARFEASQALYRARVLLAVREVEQALVNLQSTAARSDDTQAAAEGYRAAFDATQASFKAGLSSLPQLEDARRTALAADTVQLTLQRDRMLAWVALYRAAGGGWQASAPAAPAHAGSQQ